MYSTSTPEDEEKTAHTRKVFLSVFAFPLSVSQHTSLFPVILITAHGQHCKAELEAFSEKALDNSITSRSLHYSRQAINCRSTGLSIHRTERCERRLACDVCKGKISGKVLGCNVRQQSEINFG